MRPTIRQFTGDDYSTYVAIENAVNPEYPGTAEEARFNDEHRDPKCKHQRWVAEVAGQIVGAAEYSQPAGMFHPRRFWIDIVVGPEHQNQGVGSALYDHLVASLEPFDPISLRCGGVREDNARSWRFLLDRGFHEDMRTWESRLDLGTFDPGPYAQLAAQVADSGIEITTMAQLATDPDHYRKLYDLEVAVERDVPHPEPFTPLPFEHFLKRLLADPNLLPEGYFIAVDRGAYVGESTVWSSQANSDLYVGLTGVRQEYRRKGIALALKLRAIAYAQERGYRQMKTWNESNNRPMIAINERLGFVRQPCWISMVKVLKNEGDT